MAINPLKFFIFDVEHGSSTYIRTPNGKHVVIDLGVGSFKRGDEVFSPLAYIHHNWGVNQIDLAVITHPHKDHLDDIDNLTALRPKVLYRPNHLTEREVRSDNQASGSEILDKYFQLSDYYIHPVTEDVSPTVSTNYGGVNIEFFHPRFCSRSNINNHSIVTVFSYKGSRIIIPGDNEAPSWKELLQNPAFVNLVKGTHVLVAPHHGREAGYSEELFEHLKPLLCIVSDTVAGETSVTGKYSRKCSGWDVWSRSKRTMAERFCLTTRNDKGVNIEFSHDGTNPNMFISIA
jgi:beta-lactamase superfamily II metal-dependent hydrolase